MTLAEIKGAVCMLSPRELTELTTFVYQKDNALGDEQIERDAATGKLTSIFEQTNSGKSFRKK